MAEGRCQSKENSKVTVPLLCSTVFNIFFSFHFISPFNRHRNNMLMGDSKIQVTRRFKRIFDGAEKQRFKLGILLLFVWCIPVIKVVVWCEFKSAARLFACVCLCLSIHCKECYFFLLVVFGLCNKKPRPIFSHGTAASRNETDRMAKFKHVNILFCRDKKSNRYITHTKIREWHLLRFNYSLKFLWFRLMLVITPRTHKEHTIFDDETHLHCYRTLRALNRTKTI